jgi:hypothetical protein
VSAFSTYLQRMALEKAVFSSLDQQSVSSSKVGGLGAEGGGEVARSQRSGLSFFSQLGARSTPLSAAFFEYLKRREN